MLGPACTYTYMYVHLQYMYMFMCRQLFEHTAELFTVLLESGLCETLVKVMTRLNDAPPARNDVGFDDKDILWHDVTQLVCLVLERTFW